MHWVAQRRAHDFDGGYGLANSGRWNTIGRPVTYCSTVPSLTALEKRVHITDISLLPPQAMVEYAIPDDVPVHNISFDDLPSDWASRETHTQALGDAWLEECTELILVVPSVIMPIAAAPDHNALINHRLSSSDRITITAVTPFTFDPRLL
ncbi:MAG: RES family NAD+ phosphorylase [Pseudolabrys sp.]